jgi:hypothetical protein
MGWYKDDVRESNYRGEGGVVNGVGLKALEATPEPDARPQKLQCPKYVHSAFIVLTFLFIVNPCCSLFNPCCSLFPIWHLLHFILWLVDC